MFGACQQFTTFPQLSYLLYLEPASKWRPFPSCQVFYTCSLAASDDLSLAVSSFIPVACQQGTTFPQLSDLLYLEPASKWRPFTRCQIFFFTCSLPASDDLSPAVKYFWHSNVFSRVKICRPKVHECRIDFLLVTYYKILGLVLVDEGGGGEGQELHFHLKLHCPVMHKCTLPFHPR